MVPCPYSRLPDSESYQLANETDLGRPDIEKDTRFHACSIDVAIAQYFARSNDLKRAVSFLRSFLSHGCDPTLVQHAVEG